MPAALEHLIRWLLWAVEHICKMYPSADGGGHLRVVSGLLDAMSDAHSNWMTNLNELPLLRSVIRVTAQVVASKDSANEAAPLFADLPAQSSRNDTLGWVYTSCVWHIAGQQTTKAYVERLMLPQLMRSRVSGLPGVQRLTLHLD